MVVVVDLMEVNLVVVVDLKEVNLMEVNLVVAKKAWLLLLKKFEVVPQL